MTAKDRKGKQKERVIIARLILIFVHNRYRYEQKKGLSESIRERMREREIDNCPPNIAKDRDRDKEIK